MKENYPTWYKKYEVKTCDYKYLTDSARMRWNANILKDTYRLREKVAEEVLKWMFENP